MESKQEEKLCPCGSEFQYTECCKKFHDGAVAENPLTLMRSRYSAFAMNIPNYLIETTHPDNPGFRYGKEKWAREIGRFSRITEFIKLEIMDSWQGYEEATVTFCAHLKVIGKEATFTEKSRFVKKDDRWVYIDGITRPGRTNIE